jgi:sec-independent protein translocase protein TatB
VFGVSFPELVILGAIALLVLGPKKLPSMLRTLGQWLGKLRRLTPEVRYQSGIDEALRSEGLDGGLNELRSIMRGGAPQQRPYTSPPVQRSTRDPFTPDRSREYPLESADSYAALPEDLVNRPEQTSAKADVPPPPPSPAQAVAPAGEQHSDEGNAS